MQCWQSNRTISTALQIAKCVCVCVPRPGGPQHTLLRTCHHQGMPSLKCSSTNKRVKPWGFSWDQVGACSHTCQSLTRCTHLPITHTLHTCGSDNRRTRCVSSQRHNVQPCECMQAHQPGHQPTHIHYGRRWGILGIVALLQLSNAMQWVNYAPVAQLAAGESTWQFTLTTLHRIASQRLLRSTRLYTPSTIGLSMNLLSHLLDKTHCITRSQTHSHSFDALTVATVRLGTQRTTTHRAMS